MLLQASVNTFMKSFAEFVEILKTISYEPACHWNKGQNVSKKENTAMFLIFLFFLKWQTILMSQSLNETFVLVFYAKYLRLWEQCLKEIFSCHPWWESIEINVLFYVHHWGEPCLTQISIWKGIITSNARFDSVGNYSSNQHQNLEKSQLQYMNLE